MTSTVIPWLNSQIADLTRERDELRAEVERLKVADKYAHKTVDRLDAENERLRAALSFDDANIWTAAQQRELESARAEVEETHSQITTLEWKLSEATKAAEELKYENRALQGDLNDSDHADLVQARATTDLLRAALTKHHPLQAEWLLCPICTDAFESADRQTFWQS